MIYFFKEMPFTTHQRHKKVIEMAKGFKGKGKNCFTIAVRRVNKSMQNEYIGRKLMKRDIRSLWIERINVFYFCLLIIYRHLQELKEYHIVNLCLVVIWQVSI